MRLALAPALMALLAGPAPSVPAPLPADGLELEWRGKRKSLEQVQEALEPDQADALGAAFEAYGPWAAEHDYRLTLDEQARVLLVHEHKLRKRKGELHLVEEALGHLELLFPDEPQPALLAQEPTGDADDPATRAAGELRAEAQDEDSGSLDDLQQCELPVIFLIAGDRDLASLLDVLGAQHDYLAPWIPGAKGQAGFVLQEPLVAGFLTRGEGLEEWSPDGELVHRLVRLGLLQRFGRLPDWYTLGLAWCLEEELTGSFYCFPGRNQFVGIGEHGSWDKALRNRYRDKDTPPLSFEQLAEVSSTRFDTQRSHLAWGAVSFLAQHHPASMARFARAYRAERRKGERRELGGGRWSLIADYQVPAATQGALLEQAVGGELLGELVEFFLKGSRYRPVRAK